MKKKLCTHIYFGTAGAAGLYTEAIRSNLENIDSHAFITNYYFPGDGTFRLFYKNTEMSGPNFLKNYQALRYVVRYFELIFGLLLSFCIVVINRSKVVNYSLISQHFCEFLFLGMLKYVFKKKIILTLHDVVPFKSYYKSIISPVKTKQRILALADYLLVHNNASIADLHSNFVVKSTVGYHPFPLMDPSLLFKSQIDNKNQQKEKFTFLFVGQPREEKGLDLLCDAWKIFCEKNESCRLIIATNIKKESDLYFKFMKSINCKVIAKFIPDEQYFSLISCADCVVLPYRAGTNSGVPGTIAALQTALITSDISMFCENEFVPNNSTFVTGNAESLASKMQDVFFNDLSNYTISQESIIDYNKKYARLMNKYYNQIFSTLETVK